MAQEPITTSGPTITVSSAEELSEAYSTLSNTPGGGKIILESGNYGNWSLGPYGTSYGTEPVVIASEDTSDPAEFTEIYLREVENIRIENIVVDGTSLGLDDGKTAEFTVHDAVGIQVVNSVFTFDSDNAMKDSGTVVTERGISIRDSEQVVFEGNYIDGHLHGIGLSEVVEIDILNNEFTNIVGDGIRGGGLQQVTIAGNYMHDFYGVDQDITHSDLIQVWGNQNDLITEDLTITGNILLARDAASQSIFIRNEEFGFAGDSTNGYFQNITITNNLIYNGMRHGIHVSDAEGVLVDGNTLIWNPDAQAGFSWEDPKTNDPMIVVRNVLDTHVSNNITSDIHTDGDITLADNQIITYDNPEAASYVGNHFVNATAGDAFVLEGLFVLENSPFYGVYGSFLGNLPASDVSNGATAVITATTSDDDAYEVTFDAGESTDDDGLIGSDSSYSYHWTFADGTTAEGQSVTKVFDSGGFKSVSLEIEKDGEVVAAILRNYEVETKDILAFDFETGAVDISDGAPEVIDNGRIVDSEDGKGFLIGDDNKLEIDRSTDAMFDLNSFGLALDLTPTGDERSGIFLDLKSSMEAWVTSDGRFGFELVTDQGTYELVSQEPVFDDGETHRIGIAFDGENGNLELFADGESVSSVEAWGTTPGAQYWNVVFGNTFGDSMDAIIDNVEMSTDPSVASAEFGATAPEVQPPVVNDPPAEEEVDPPVVNDPPAEEPAEEEVDPPVASDPPAEEPAEEEVDPPVASDPPAEEEVDPPVASDPPAEEPADEEVDPPVASDPPAEEPADEEVDPPVVNDPPAEEPAEEEVDPPVASDPPAEEPAEEEVDPPVASDPPAEEPADEEADPAPEEDDNPRGAPPEVLEADGDRNLLQSILDFFLSIFGLDDDDDPAPVQTASEALPETASLSNIVPVTAQVDELPDEAEDEDDLTDLAA